MVEQKKQNRARLLISAPFCYMVEVISSAKGDKMLVKRLSAIEEAELFGPEPDHDMALAFVEMCRDIGWTVEDSLALAQQIRLKGEHNETEPSV